VAAVPTGAFGRLLQRSENMTGVQYVNEVLVRYGEIFLKSEPVRKRYELVLENNIRNALKRKGIDFSLYRKRFRFFVAGAGEGAVNEVLRKTPGVVSFSPCFRIKSSDLKVIRKFCADNYESWIRKGKSFAVRARRTGKQTYTSNDAEREIGAVIDRKVNLSRPDRTVSLEIWDGECYVYTDTVRGVGGLPVGASGRVMSLLSAGIDSPVSSFLMMKRGCRVDFVHFHSFPVVSNRSITKARELAAILNSFQLKCRLFIVPFSGVQLKIKTGVPEKYRVILYRRAMLKIAGKIAEREGVKVLCTGESLGQVSSQTLSNLVTTDSTIRMPVLRPLIGMDKEEITALAKSIGSYEVSIEPHEDCCTLFVPKHAATQSEAREMEGFEKKLKLGYLVNKAVKNTEKEEIK
jgi:thiamine biosynthesis protein ThiI